MSTVQSTETITGTVKLGTTTYTVTVQDCTWDDKGVAKARTNVYLTGPRGGMFLVRPFIYGPGREDKGLHQVISLKSGAELTSKGNRVMVVMVGDIITQATAEQMRGR